MVFTPSTINPNAPFGLRAVKFDEKENDHFSISNSDAIIYLNEPIQYAGGSNAAAIGNSPAGTLPVVTGAAATGVFLGSILSVVPSNTISPGILYNPASTAAEVIVCKDPNAEYEIMTGNGTIAATDIGKNANLGATPTGGSTLTGLSSAYLDVATINTTSTLQLRILGIKNQVDNVLGQFAIARVRINNTNYTQNTAGI